MYSIGILGTATYIGVNNRRGVWLGVEMGYKLLLPGEITAFMLLMQFRGRKSGREKMRIHHFVHTTLYSVESESSQLDLLGPITCSEVPRVKSVFSIQRKIPPYGKLRWICPPHH